jgi:hypothetical protein
MELEVASCRRYQAESQQFDEEFSKPPDSPKTVAAK